jgi:hypothetical protein
VLGFHRLGDLGRFGGLGLLVGGVGRFVGGQIT